MIRKANPSEAEPIRQIHLSAFDDDEKESVADLAVALLQQYSTPESIHLVAADGDKLIGHIAFSPVYSKATCNCIGYILAPLAVAPTHQKKGIGRDLIETGLRALSQRDVDVVLVYGDPLFYSHFGFKPELAENFRAPFDLTYPSGWQAIELSPTNSSRTSQAIQCVPVLSNPALW